MTECDSELPYDFYSQRALVVRFSDLELSSDAGILLARQAEKKVQVCQAIAESIERQFKSEVHHRLIYQHRIPRKAFYNQAIFWVGH